MSKVNYILIVAFLTITCCERKKISAGKAMILSAQVRSGRGELLEVYSYYNNEIGNRVYHGKRILYNPVTDFTVVQEFKEGVAVNSSIRKLDGELLSIDRLIDSNTLSGGSYLR